MKIPLALFAALALAGCLSQYDRPTGVPTAPFFCAQSQSLSGWQAEIKHGASRNTVAAVVCRESPDPGPGSLLKNTTMKPTATRRATARPRKLTAEEIRAIALDLDRLAIRIYRRPGLAAVTAGNEIGAAACNLNNLAFDVLRSEVGKERSATLAPSS